MKLEQPIILKIKKIKFETPLVKTFVLDHFLDSKPGQFVMAWLPGEGAKPFAITYDDKIRGLAFSVYKRGPFTKKLFQLKKGNEMGIFGPYGNHYNFQPKSHTIMVAGGYGTAPLAFLAEEVLKNKGKVDFFTGACSKKDLLFIDRLKKNKNLKIHITTEDCSVGYQGFITDILKPFLEKNIKSLKNAKIYSCGPEQMQKVVVEMAQKYKIPVEISLERYVKCGFGVCGQCVVDPLGIRMCKEGPVISGELAARITEFGKYHRDGSGQKVQF